MVAFLKLMLILSLLSVNYIVNHQCLTARTPMSCYRFTSEPMGALETLLKNLQDVAGEYLPLDLRCS